MSGQSAERATVLQRFGQRLGLRRAEGADVADAARGDLQMHRLMYIFVLVIGVCIYESVTRDSALPMLVPVAPPLLSIFSRRVRMRMLSQALWYANRCLGEDRPRLELTTPSPASGDESVNFFIPGADPVHVSSGAFYTGKEGPFTLLSVSLTNTGKKTGVLRVVTLTPHPTGKVLVTSHLIEPGTFVRINAAVMNDVAVGHDAMVQDRFQLRVAYSDPTGLGSFSCVAELTPYWGARLVSF